MTTDYVGGDVTPLGSYVRRVGRWWALVPFAALVGAVLGAGLATTQSDEYTAEVRVLIPDADRAELASQEAIIYSSRTLAEVAEEFSTSTDAVAASLDVDVLDDSRVVAIGYTDATPGLARAHAQAVAEAFLTQREALLDDELMLRLAELDEREAVLRAEYDSAGGNLPTADLRDTFALSRIEGELAAISRQRAELIGSNRDGGTIVDDGSESTVEAGTPTAVFVAAGALIGALAVIAVALVANRREQPAPADEPQPSSAPPAPRSEIEVQAQSVDLTDSLAGPPPWVTAPELLELVRQRDRPVVLEILGTDADIDVGALAQSLAAELVTELDVLVLDPGLDGRPPDPEATPFSFDEVVQPTAAGFWIGNRHDSASNLAADIERTRRHFGVTLVPVVPTTDLDRYLKARADMDGLLLAHVPGRNMKGSQLHARLRDQAPQPTLGMIPVWDTAPAGVTPAH